jgi:hypothetical protein
MVLFSVEVRSFVSAAPAAGLVFVHAKQPSPAASQMAERFLQLFLPNHAALAPALSPIQ